MSRYKTRQKATNSSESYKDIFDEKGVKQIKQYRTPILREMKNLSYKQYVWKNGDTFWKLSFDYYGDTSYWYIIAQFNSTPTEAHVSEGDTIRIPIDLAQALRII